jgi:parallel beta-helix repeat protein
VRGRSKSRIAAPLMISLLIIAGFIGILDCGTDVVKAPPTYVSGIVYDGAGGPWTLVGSPYIVVGEITVPQGQILTIEPGVEVKFDGFYRISVEGNLSAIGTQNNRVNITSNITTPSWGDWQNIWIYSTGRAEIHYCDINYAEIGIYITGSSNNNISNNNISNNGAGMSVGGSNNIITNNDVFFNDYWGIASGLGIGHNLIANNNISSNGGEGIYLYAAYENYIIGNNISNNSYYGILAEHGGGNMIADNNIFLNVYAGITLADGIGNNITNNNISSNSRNGIGAWNSGGNNIWFNNISSNNESGVNISASSSSIMRNNITSNGRGVTLSSRSRENRIAFNNVSNNNKDGFLVGGRAVNSTLEFNTVFENEVGIHIADYPFPGPLSVPAHLISNNVVFNNTIGIGMDTNDTGLIENAKIISNAIKENDIGINISANVQDSLISKNTIEENRIGLQKSLGGGLRPNHIIFNTIINNQDYAVYLNNTENTHFHHNNFINNGIL